MKTTFPQQAKPGAPAGRPRTEDRDARLEHLLEIAGTMFIRHGYANVSLMAIARTAHVAVRTIYVHFGGKAGLLKAAVMQRHHSFFGSHDMLSDTRPLKEVVRDFALRLSALQSNAEVIAILRMVILEARDTSGLADAFYEHGPRHTRAMLTAYFARADVRAQVRANLAPGLVAQHLINCIGGDRWAQLTLDVGAPARAQAFADLDQRLGMFYHGVMRAAGDA